jgi:hypothetical protein
MLNGRSLSCDEKPFKSVDVCFVDRREAGLLLLAVCKATRTSTTKSTAP